MSPRRGRERERALAAQLEDEWRLPSQRSPGMTPLGAGTRRHLLDETHNFEGPGPAEAEQVQQNRADTTARAGAGSPRRFVTET